MCNTKIILIFQTCLDPMQHVSCFHSQTYPINLSFTNIWLTSSNYLSYYNEIKTHGSESRGKEESSSAQ